jgi:1-acyl-sn-glycerol-3-phosphate acyltransferase
LNDDINIAFFYFGRNPGKIKYLLSRFLYRVFIRPAVVKLVNLLWIDKVVGIENIPKDSGAILAANHSSYLDFIIVPSVITEKIKRPTFILAAAELTKHPVVGIFARNDDCILIDRTKVANKPGTQFYKDSLKALEDKRLLLLFPEGTRSPDGAIQPWKKGFVKMAVRARVPIIPITLKGTYELLPKGGKFINFRKRCEVIIHKPIDLQEYFGTRLDKETAQKIADSIREKVASAL